MPVDELTRWRRGLKRQACMLLGIEPRNIRLRLLTRADPRYSHGLFGIAVAPNTILTRPRTGIVTYIHELLHLLFPRQAHWWVFGAAYILADRPERTIPWAIEAAAQLGISKAKLMRQARAAARERGFGG